FSFRFTPVKKRKWLYIGLGALVLLIGFPIGKKMIVGADPLIVQTAKATRQSITETVNASGKVQPEKEVKISAAIYGEITELPVKEGEQVKKGQLLARIKPNQYQLG